MQVNICHTSSPHASSEAGSTAQRQPLTIECEIVVYRNHTIGDAFVFDRAGHTLDHRCDRITSVRSYLSEHFGAAAHIKEIAV